MQFERRSISSAAQKPNFPIYRSINFSGLFWTVIDEHRTARRHRVLKAGTIRRRRISCMVRNFSNAGAALDVTSPIGIPDHFTLVLPAAGHHMPCHVIWRKQRRIGVAFD
jgi:hypothetical protein